MVKNPPANAGDMRDASSIPGLGTSPGRGHGRLLQYCCLKPGGLQSMGSPRVGHNCFESEGELSKWNFTSYKRSRIVFCFMFLV